MDFVLRVNQKPPKGGFLVLTEKINYINFYAHVHTLSTEHVRVLGFSHEFSQSDTLLHPHLLLFLSFCKTPLQHCEADGAVSSYAKHCGVAVAT
jgi:hypothetical protein